MCDYSFMSISSRLAVSGEDRRVMALAQGISSTRPDGLYSTGCPLAETGYFNKAVT